VTARPTADTGDPGAAFQGKRIVLCVTGGIAAYKVVYVARTLAQMGADVRVVMTPSAERFVGAPTFAALTGNPVSSEMFDGSPDVPHVELARGTDLVIVAPATANAIAKIAVGLSDDLFSATVLTATCPVVVVPAMHAEMWEHAATKVNLTMLRERGATIVGPAEGSLSSGDEGVGRMVEPEEIVAAAAEVLGAGRALTGRRVLVTAGGTQEPIDPVRFIGNRSSGRMGAALADEAMRRGAKVTLVAGITSVDLPAGADVVRVRTAEEMRGAVVTRAGSADAIVMAAAVADFKPSGSSGRKLKKADGPPDITLVPTPDVLAELGAHPEVRKPGGVLVGFAAETEPDLERLKAVAAEKRASKNADLMVANDVGSPDSGFEVDTDRAVIAGPDGTTEVGMVTKRELARLVLDRVTELLGRSE
jgi:phosphopantothenoylcysteine decarboxylase / phosphopantothenate---cysteine ligase